MAVVLYRKDKDGTVRREIFPCSSFRNQFRNGWCVSKTGEDKPKAKPKAKAKKKVVKKDESNTKD